MTREKQPIVRLEVRIPADLATRLRVVARAEDRSLNAAIVYAVRRYVTAKERGAANEAQ